MASNVRTCESVSDFTAWDDFVSDYQGAHYFQTYGWLNSYRPMGMTPHLLVHETDNRITAGVAFLSAKIPLSPFSIVIIPHGPLPSDPGHPGWAALMSRLDEFCQKKNTIYAQIYPHELMEESAVHQRLEELGFTSPALFTSHRFSTTPVLVDLAGKTEEEVLKSFRQRTGSYIRAAMKSELKLRTEVTPQIFDQIYRLFDEHAQSRGFRARPYASLQTIWDWFAPKGGATFIQAWSKDTLVGANLALYAGRKAYYIHGAVRREFDEQRPAEFLHWQTMRKAMERQLDSYDLVNIGHPGVDQFKRGFKPTVRFWHEPKTKIYWPTLSRLLRFADQSLTPMVRAIGRNRARLADWVRPKAK